MTAYLTVDDAPSEQLPEKLAILEDRDVPALFFCEGRRLTDDLEHARHAVEAGFHLGNHAYTHQHASESSVETFRDEVERTESLLEDVYDQAGVTRPARVFRFPFGDEGGECADQFQEVLADFGFIPPNPARITYDWYDDRHADSLAWAWTVSVDDWQLDTISELREQVDAVTDRLDHPSNDIILFHDAGNTTALFEAFVDVLLDRGVDFGDPIDLLD